MPKHEPEVNNAHSRRMQEVMSKLKAAGLPTDINAVLGPDIVDTIQGLSAEDKIITSVASSLFMLVKSGAKLTSEEVTEEIADLIEILLTQGGVMALEQVAQASEAGIEDAIAKNGPPPTELDSAKINFYALAKSMEIGHQTLQERRNHLRFTKFKRYAEKALAQHQQKGPKV
jgi:hypothetical protein